MLYLYIIVCILWGLLSSLVQKKLYPSKSRFDDLLVSSILNAMICPISMGYAIYRLMTNTSWAAKINAID